jgi:hypothetical protein
MQNKINFNTQDHANTTCEDEITKKKSTRLEV